MLTLGPLPASIFATAFSEILYFVLPTLYSICPSFSSAFQTLMYMPFFKWMVSAWAMGIARDSTQAARTALMWDMENVGGEPIYSLKWAVGQGTSWLCSKLVYYLLV